MSVAKTFIFAAVLLVCSSCNRVRSVQLHPPIPLPPGLVSGYGVEKISGNAERARQAAYLKAMDDLLTHSGPVLVSKTVQDQTTVVGAKPANRILASTFRLRASRLLQPSFQQNGVEHGFVWVLLASSEDEIERGWQQFLVWRTERVEQAQKLFQDAKGPGRVQILKAALSLLEDAGAADDPGLLYFDVKTALDTEIVRIAKLERFHKEFRSLADSGQLTAAETALEDAQSAGLDQPTYQKCVAELSDRRTQALQHVEAGDDLLRDEHYKEARIRYEQARKIDRDNSLIGGKIATAERFEKESRARNVRATVGFVVPAAVRTLGEYFEYKQEQERRKREEEARKRQEADRAAEEERNRENEKRRNEENEEEEDSQRDPPHRRGRHSRPERP